MTRLARRLLALFRSRRVDDDLAQEIETHRALVQQDLERRGLLPEAAERASRRALGNVALAREDARHVWSGTGVERLWQDVQYGARMLRRNPSFTAVAVTTLAIGIGANTAMFSVVNAVLLRPLPYADPGKLVAVWIADPKLDVREAGTSYPTFTDWRTQNRRFADMAIWATAAARVMSGREPERVSTTFVSANLFPLLGVQPVLGRVFSAEDEARRDRVVVLSYALWQRQFGGDPNILDKTLEIDGETPEGMAEMVQRPRIVGVMPEHFYFPSRDVQFWRPATLLGIDGKPKLYERQWNDRFIDRWRVVARLAPGATVGDGQADLASIGRRLAESYPVPAGAAGFPGFGVDVVPMLEQVTGRNLGLALWVLLGAVGFVLLIACANVANLLLARGTTRGREFAIRTALGAGRARIVRQLCVESVMLAAVAGLVGTAVATVGIRGLAASTVPGIPRLTEISVDRSVLLFTAALSIVSGLLFGLAPAWNASRGNANEPLKETGGGLSSSLRLRRARGLLVIGQCALAVVLLAGAGLLVRSFGRLMAVDPGFEPDGVLLARVDLPIPVSRTWREQEWATFQQIEERVAHLPGVSAAGFIQNVAVASSPRTPITIDGRTAADESLDLAGVNLEEVTPGFFRAMGVALDRGRFFTAAEQNAPLAIVNQAFVRRFFPGEDPIGKRFRQGRGGTKVYWYTIVGVVGDMRRQGLERFPLPEFFIPSTEPAMDFVVRGAGDPVRLAAAVRHELRSTLPSAIVVRLTTLEAFMGEWSAERKFQAWLLTAFAALALALAGIGIYGVMQFAAVQRSKEMGIRVALGARGVDLLRLMIGQGLRLPLAGLAVGLLGAYVLGGVLQRSLFEVPPGDPVTYAGVAIALGGTALIACYLPARRAARVDPIVALRDE
jgi:putative ABC transport system permease protein